MRKGTPIKSVDEQGRVLIPSHIRESIDLRPGDPVEVLEAGGDAILVRRIVERCIACGTPLNDGKCAEIDSVNKLCLSCWRTGLKNMTRK